MKNISIKLALIPLLLIPTILSGCNKAKTYRQVVLEDLIEQRQEVDKRLSESIKTASDTQISRSYIFVNGAISFDINPKYDISLCIDRRIILDDDLSITFWDETLVPYIWKNHKFLTFKEAYDDGVYSREDIMRIQEMHNNKENDFSFLDLPFVEEPE